MNYTNYTDIETLVSLRLPEKDFKEVLDRIDFLISAGSTGGEINDTVAGYLNSLKKQKSPAYELLRPEVDKYLSLFDLF